MQHIHKNILFGFFLLLFYAGSYLVVIQQREARSGSTHVQHSGIWNLPDPALHLIAGEFKGLVADYLTLEAGAQLGTKLVKKPEGGYKRITLKRDWPTIHQLFRASQSLDPSFLQTMNLAQGWLPWEADMVQETQQILQTADKNRPWDWQPLRFVGFNTYYFLNDPGEAGKLFLKAANRPDAPDFLAIIGARLAQKGGETKAAIVLMKSMLINKDSNDPGYDDMRDRYHALAGTVIVEKGITAYYSKYNAYPESVTELVTAGFLQQTPSNPYDLEYCIDRSGKVYFDNPNCRQ